MNRVLSTPGRIATLIAATGFIASAQGTQTASLSGLVVDRGGNPVVSARVELTSRNMQGKREIQTDAAGRFISRLLPPGQYHILISKESFYTATVDVHLGLEQTYSPKIVLAPVAMATVEVVGALPGADKAEIKSAVNYTSEQIDNLPVKRGDALDIAYLSPGVTKNSNSDKGNIEIRGASGQGNLVLVDGQNVMDNVYSGQRIGIIFDAVEETQVMTGAVPAEYGYVEGGVINQITKVGGNEFSGSLRYDFQNPAWNAVNPMNSRESLGNNLSQSTSITLGGPIIKDKLWFFGAFYENKPFSVNSYSGLLESGADQQDWVSNVMDLRREIKLTFSPNPDHTFSASYNNSSNKYLRDASGAGEYAALSPFGLLGDFWTVSYRGILSDALTFNARVGAKHQEFSSEPNPKDYTQGVQIATGQTSEGAVFGSPYWDPTDPQPDNRDNTTANLKLSYFWNASGSHETDFGYDYYLGTTKSSGFQSSGRITVPGYANNQPMDWWNVVVSWYTLPTKKAAIWSDLGSYDFGINTQQYVPDTLKVTTHGLYVNDKWTVNSHLMVNLGLRYDKYEAKADSKGKISSSSVVSPRLGLKYDFWGDSKLVGGLSWSVLQGRLQETQLQAATYVFHPISYFFGANTNNENFMKLLTAADTKEGNIPIQDLLDGIRSGAFIDTTREHVGITNAVVGNKFDPGLKPPKVDEYQGTLAYNFTSETFGTGFLRATAVSRKWSNIIDVVVGRPGQTQDEAGNTLDVNYWTNQPLAKRDYKALTLEANTKLGKWQFQGNVTWSELKGNGTGEGKSTPSNPYGIEIYNVAATADHTPVYNTALTAPYGRLSTLGNPAPLAINAIVGYTTDNAYGKLTYGVNYRFSSGAHYDEARTVDLSAFQALAADSNVSSFAYNVLGTSEFRNGQRGTGVFNGSSYTDLSIQQDFAVLKILKKDVSAFVKVNFYNVWNHQQLVSWNVGYAPNSSGTIGAAGPAWTPSGSNGLPSKPSDYGDARSMTLSAGFKF